MSTEFPTSRCREMVDGGIMSWPCSLPVNHVGPHEAIEVPVSSVRRKQWLQEQESASAVSTTVGEASDAKIVGSMFHQETLPLAPATSTVVLNPSSINDEKQRLEAILRLLTKPDHSSLPSSVASWVMGMLAQTSLLALWEMASKEFADGASGVVITPEYLHRIVPQSLRSYLGRD